MGYPTKIATCCYCGSRAALVLGKDRHELTCASCGAPLHDMKRLRSAPDASTERYHQPERRPGKTKKHKYKSYAPSKPKYKKKRKGLMRHLIEEAFDVIEDILD